MKDGGKSMSVGWSCAVGRQETVAQVAEDARVAEACGFEYVTFGDHQNLDRDVYMMMAGAAQATRSITVGQLVTVPQTRHPSVTANATATLNEMFPGRVLLGIGAGGNAVRSMGGKARPMEEYRECVEFIRDWLVGKEAEWHGQRMHSEWSRTRVPIAMAVVGPKSCRLAGELADTVILSTGVHPEVVKWRVEKIHDGAEQAGRDPADIDIWLCNTLIVAESREAARREASGKSARAIWQTFGLHKGPEYEDLYRRVLRVMPDLDDLIAEGKIAFDNYNEYEHEVLDSEQSRFMTQRMIDFIHMTGTPDEVQEMIESVVAVGVTHICCQLYTVEDKHGQLRTISETLMPRFAEPGAERGLAAS